MGTRAWCFLRWATHEHSNACRKAGQTGLGPVALHTSRADLRARLLSQGPTPQPRRTGKLANKYARATGYPIQYQWTLLAGINDSQEEIDGIVRLLFGQVRR